MKIFISYSRHDLDTVSELVSDLEASRHDVWRDEKLSGGQTWWDQILEQIRECDLFVVALSSHSLASGPCASEYSYAHQLNKRVLPVRVDDRTSVQELPPELSQLQWEQFVSGDKMSSLRVLGAINNLPPARPPPESPPPQPEIPVSYLTHLREKVSDPSPISVADQAEIVRDLETRFIAQDDPIAIENVLMALERRPELTKPVHRQVRALRKRVEAAQPQPARAQRDLRSIATVVAGLVILGALASVVILARRDGVETIAGSPEGPTASVGDSSLGSETQPTTVPNTDPPTTVTLVAVTEAPTTQPPTTRAPTTQAPTTQRRTTQPPTTSQPVPDDAGDLDIALLEQFVNQLSFTSGLGCETNVYNYAASLSLAWQYFGNEVWYWDHVWLYWMRTDGLQYFPATGQYWSFCTGLRWDHINSVWG